jgi:hypothetical protein
MAVSGELTEQETQIPQRVRGNGSVGIQVQPGIHPQQPLQDHLPELLSPCVPFLSPSLQRSLTEVLLQGSRFKMTGCNLLLCDVICPLPLVMAGQDEREHFAAKGATEPLYTDANQPADTAAVNGFAGIAAMPMEMHFFRTTLALAPGGQDGMRPNLIAVELLKNLVRQR